VSILSRSLKRRASQLPQYSATGRKVACTHMTLRDCSCEEFVSDRRNPIRPESNRTRIRPTRMRFHANVVPNNFRQRPMEDS
jgi:hypothetical protein